MSGIVGTRQKILTIDRYKVKTAVQRVRSLVSEKVLQILQVREFPEVTSNSDLVAYVSRRNNPDCVIELLKTRYRYGPVATGIDKPAGRCWNLDGRRISGNYWLIDLVKMERCLLTAKI